MSYQVLLSFDIEEFDMPAEYGKSIPIDDQISISTQGTEIILNILQAQKAKATFFSTVVFASKATHLIKRIISEGHELASHGYYHSQFEVKHLQESRLALAALSNSPVIGFRMPRMMPVEDAAIHNAGYHYNSSLNPIYLPGRYNNLSKPRTLFKTGDTWQLPASVTPMVRFPLFWLSFHNLPLSLYERACARTMEKDGYLNLYFHPWEFTDLHDPKLGMPWFVRKNSGKLMTSRMENLLKWMQRRNYTFSTIAEFLKDR